eukprot:3990120-Prorocentrum_lima.AAC.1
MDDNITVTTGTPQRSPITKRRRKPADKNHNTDIENHETGPTSMLNLKLIMRCWWLHLVCVCVLRLGSGCERYGQ